MIRAVWNGTVLAETPRTVRLEGNHYFPPESLTRQYFTTSKRTTLCPWKGIASYYHLTTEDGTLPDGAWYYPHPSPPARRIKNHVAFFGDITIEGQPEPRPAGERGLRAALNRLLGRSHAS